MTLKIKEIKQLVKLLGFSENTFNKVLFVNSKIMMEQAV